MNRIIIENLKRTNKTDLKQIIKIYKTQNWWYNYDNKKRLKKIIKGSHIFIMAKENKKIIAMARVISDKANDAYIQDFAVLPEYRKKGIGKKILEHIIKELKKKNFKWLGLIADKNTINFYKKSGFKLMKNFKPMIYDKF